MQSVSTCIYHTKKVPTYKSRHHALSHTLVTSSEAGEGAERVSGVRKMVSRLPPPNKHMLKMLVTHLEKVRKEKDQLSP